MPSRSSDAYWHARGEGPDETLTEEFVVTVAGAEPLAATAAAFAAGGIAEAQTTHGGAKYTG
eukprot:CAMPEP_0113718786 /NCGR_PEP_ID=MMETSP0038_2-20120614/35410_1 /TAXON_ID=2898 /ORGANISM="Cryptomonas paramecium" /LENGTH=61 /DNA_ID=CAMNT_0000647001 /DNA_START=259 /DNA_END=441 /DNA_ORIENTATION=+ /assembly_acc=CAM_ASM_000170